MDKILIDLLKKLQELERKDAKSLKSSLKKYYKEMKQLIVRDDRMQENFLNGFSKIYLLFIKLLKKSYTPKSLLKNSSRRDILRMLFTIVDYGQQDQKSLAFMIGRNILSEVVDANKGILFNKLLLRVFIIAFNYIPANRRAEIIPDFYFMGRVSNAIALSGDFEYQALLLELLLRINTKDDVIRNVNKWFLNETLQSKLINFNYECYDASANEFLRLVNQQSKTVHSIHAKKVYCGKYKVIPGIKSRDDDGIWLYVNINSKSIEMQCHRNFFTMEFDKEPENKSQWETLTVLNTNIKRVSRELCKTGGWQLTLSLKGELLTFIETHPDILQCKTLKIYLDSLVAEQSWLLIKKIFDSNEITSEDEDEEVSSIYSQSLIDNQKVLTNIQRTISRCSTISSGVQSLIRVMHPESPVPPQEMVYENLKDDDDDIIMSSLQPTDYYTAQDSGHSSPTVSTIKPTNKSQYSLKSQDNVNLSRIIEAIDENDCMIIPESQPETDRILDDLQYRRPVKIVTNMPIQEGVIEDSYPIVVDDDESEGEELKMEINNNDDEIYDYNTITNVDDEDVEVETIYESYNKNKESQPAIILENNEISCKRNIIPINILENDIIQPNNVQIEIEHYKVFQNNSQDVGKNINLNKFTRLRTKKSSSKTISNTNQKDVVNPLNTSENFLENLETIDYKNTPKRVLENNIELSSDSESDVSQKAMKGSASNNFSNSFNEPYVMANSKLLECFENVKISNVQSVIEKEINLSSDSEYDVHEIIASQENLCKKVAQGVQESECHGSKILNQEDQDAKKLNQNDKDSSTPNEIHEHSETPNEKTDSRQLVFSNNDFDDPEFDDPDMQWLKDWRYDCDIEPSENELAAAYADDVHDEEIDKENKQNTDIDKEEVNDQNNDKTINETKLSHDKTQRNVAQLESDIDLDKTTQIIPELAELVDEHEKQSDLEIEDIQGKITVENEKHFSESEQENKNVNDVTVIEVETVKQTKKRAKGKTNLKFLKKNEKALPSKTDLKITAPKSFRKELNTKRIQKNQVNESFDSDVPLSELKKCSEKKELDKKRNSPINKKEIETNIQTLNKRPNTRQRNKLNGTKTEMKLNIFNTVNDIVDKINNVKKIDKKEAVPKVMKMKEKCVELVEKEYKLKTEEQFTGNKQNTKINKGIINKTNLENVTTPNEQECIVKLPKSSSKISDKNEQECILKLPKLTKSSSKISDKNEQECILKLPKSSTKISDKNEQECIVKLPKSSSKISDKIKEPPVLKSTEIEYLPEQLKSPIKKSPIKNKQVEVQINNNQETTKNDLINYSDEKESENSSQSEEKEPVEKQTKNKNTEIVNDKITYRQLKMDKDKSNWKTFLMNKTTKDAQEGTKKSDITIISSKRIDQIDDNVNIKSQIKKVNKTVKKEQISLNKVKENYENNKIINEFSVKDDNISSGESSKSDDKIVNKQYEKFQKSPGKLDAIIEEIPIIENESNLREPEISVISIESNEKADLNKSKLNENSVNISETGQNNPEYNLSNVDDSICGIKAIKTSTPNIYATNINKRRKLFNLDDSMRPSPLLTNAASDTPNKSLFPNKTIQETLLPKVNKAVKRPLTVAKPNLTMFDQRIRTYEKREPFRFSRVDNAANTAKKCLERFGLKSNKAKASDSHFDDYLRQYREEPLYGKRKWADFSPYDCTKKRKTFLESPKENNLIQEDNMIEQFDNIIDKMLNARPQQLLEYSKMIAGGIIKVANVLQSKLNV